MDAIKKGYTYLQKVLIMLYLLSLIWIPLYLVTDYIFYLYYEVVNLFIIGFMSFFLYHHYQKQIKYLINCSDAIVEQKPIQIIDGEGDLSLLSHKLYLLYKRYHVLNQTMQQEQIKLKDYIEDISHQLKTPITSMRINEELLLESLENDKQKEKLQTIYQQTLKMNRLVNDLLTLALLDSNSIQLRYHDEKIEYIMEEVEENLEYLLLKYHVTLKTVCQNVTILCDHKWFVEALENIIKNCIEKNEDGYIDIIVEDYEAMIKMLIYDHGQGFDGEDIEHLFERFYRGQNETISGIGIGLSLSKEIIEKHHGMIRAYNQKGAVFEITLPKLLAKKKI